MDVVAFNFSWMLYNSFLAVLPVVFALIFLTAKSKYLKILFGCAWLVFLPNTIYILTDLIHFPKDWVSVTSFERIIILMQYVALELVGFITFVFALYPLEKVLSQSKKKRQKNVAFMIIIVNFLIGFGVVLGRVERINSWEIFTHTAKVIVATITVLTTIQLLDLVILFGILTNLSYFLFRKFVMVKVGKNFRKVN